MRRKGGVGRGREKDGVRKEGKEGEQKKRREERKTRRKRKDEKEKDTEEIASPAPNALMPIQVKYGETNYSNSATSSSTPSLSSRAHKQVGYTKTMVRE